MAQVDWTAFMSYAHENGQNDRGYLSKFRELLEAEVGWLLGNKFTIFQDHIHIKTGDEWERRLEQYLSKSTFLLSIITPHYYNSEWCRREFMYFHEKEEQTQRSPLIFPIYYIECPQMKNRILYSPGTMEHLLPGYQLKDWRKLRDSKIHSAAVTRNIRQLAREIVDGIRKLESDEPASVTLSLNSLGNPLPVLNTLNHSSGGPPFDLMMFPNLPGFYGRSSEMAWVIERLTLGASPRIAALDGAQGIGKTAVAAEAVRRLHDHARYPGGIAVVLCRGLADPRVILRQALTRFHPQRLPPTSNDDVDLANEARRLLSGKQTLIVLEDIETQLNITRVIDPLCQAGAALLLTSKHPLILSNAARLTLTALEPPDALDLLTVPYQNRRQTNAERH